ncbi:hypothetical protein SFRURICE_011561 [Spodoptera frugiperda]|nr:hypothetical protein SFRURICE_011561 [Spodoptera frugiperda]
MEKNSLIIFYVDEVADRSLLIMSIYLFREQRVKFPKKRRILRPGEVISLAGFLPNCRSLGFSIRVNSHVNIVCAMQDIYDVIR